MPKATKAQVQSQTEDENRKIKQALKQRHVQAIDLLSEDTQVQGLLAAIAAYETDNSNENLQAIYHYFGFSPKPENELLKVSDVNDPAGGFLTQLLAESDTAKRKELLIKLMIEKLMGDLEDYLVYKEETNAQAAVRKDPRRGLLFDRTDELHKALAQDINDHAQPKTVKEFQEMIGRLPPELRDEFIKRRKERMEVKRFFVEVVVLKKDPNDVAYVKALRDQAISKKVLAVDPATGYDINKPLCMIDTRENYRPEGVTTGQPVHLTTVFDAPVTRDQLCDYLINRFDTNSATMDVPGVDLKGENPYAHLRFKGNDGETYAVCAEKVGGNDIDFQRFKVKDYEKFADDFRYNVDPATNAKTLKATAPTYQQTFDAFKAAKPPFISNMANSDFDKPLAEAGGYRGCSTVRELIRKAPHFIALAADCNVYDTSGGAEPPKAALKANITPPTSSGGTNVSAKVK